MEEVQVMYEHCTGGDEGEGVWDGHCNCHRLTRAATNYYSHRKQPIS